MRFGNLTNWDAKNESIDQWLEREHLATERAENPTCPHCEHIHHEWWEYSGLSDYEVEDHQIECRNCDQPFLVDKDTRIRFECRKVGEERP